MFLRDEPLPWFAVKVRSGHEKRTATVLHYKGYEWFLPLYRCQRRWSDRMKELDLPLFPGYLFCRFDVCNRLPILKTTGVLGIVGLGRTPIPVETREISALESIVKAGAPVQPWPFLEVGRQVRIEHGALRGLEGIVLDCKTQCRLVVSVTLLQRSVAVEIGRDWVSVLPPPDLVTPAFSFTVAA